MRAGVVENPWNLFTGRLKANSVSDLAIVGCRLGVVAGEPIDEPPLTGATFELDVGAREAVRVLNGEAITALAGQGVASESHFSDRSTRASGGGVCADNCFGGSGEVAIAAWNPERGTTSAP